MTIQDTKNSEQPAFALTESTGDGKAYVMVSQVVKCSVIAADALFAELEKTNQ